MTDEIDVSLRRSVFADIVSAESGIPASDAFMVVIDRILMKLYERGFRIVEVEEDVE